MAQHSASRRAARRTTPRAVRAGASPVDDAGSQTLELDAGVARPAGIGAKNRFPLAATVAKSAAGRRPRAALRQQEKRLAGSLGNQPLKAGFGLQAATREGKANGTT